MKNRAFVLLITIIAIGVATGAAAQPRAAAIDWNKVDQKVKAAPQRIEPEPAPATVAQSRLEKAQEEYEIGALQRRAEAFRWQATASRVIFWMVLSLVLAGVIFSALQFVAAMRVGGGSDQELDISLQGIKLRTQFLGVLTLGFSLAFFYLYLKTVYPIVETTVTQ